MKSQKSFLEFFTPKMQIMINDVIIFKPANKSLFDKTQTTLPIHFRQGVGAHEHHCEFTYTINHQNIDILNKMVDACDFEIVFQNESQFKCEFFINYDQITC